MLNSWWCTAFTLWHKTMLRPFRLLTGVDPMSPCNCFYNMSSPKAGEGTFVTCPRPTKKTWQQCLCFGHMIQALLTDSFLPGVQTHWAAPGQKWLVSVSNHFPQLHQGGCILVCTFVIAVNILRYSKKNVLRWSINQLKVSLKKFQC